MNIYEINKIIIAIIKKKNKTGTRKKSTNNRFNLTCLLSRFLLRNNRAKPCGHRRRRLSICWVDAARA